MQVLESVHAEDSAVAERFVESDIKAGEKGDVRVHGSGAGHGAYVKRHFDCCGILNHGGVYAVTSGEARSK
jgi:hypothetical protein